MRKQTALDITRFSVKQRKTGRDNILALKSIQYRSYLEACTSSSPLKLAVCSFVDTRDHELSIPPRGREYRYPRHSHFFSFSLRRYTENNEIDRERERKKKKTNYIQRYRFFFSNYLLFSNEFAREARWLCVINLLNESDESRRRFSVYI